MIDEADLSHLAESLHPLEKQVLRLFSTRSRQTETQLLEQEPSLNAAQLSMALGWLQTKEVISLVASTESTFASLTEVGQSYAKEKHPPLRMAEAIQTQGEVSIKELQGRSDMAAEEKSRAIGTLKADGVVAVLPGGRLKIASPEKLSPLKAIQDTIERLAAFGEPVALDRLSAEDRSVIEAHHRKRSKSKGIFRVDARVEKTYATTDIFETLLTKVSAQPDENALGVLTPEHLKDGSWRGKAFRKYNIQLPPSRIGGGAKHPYKCFLDEVKQKFVSMGFEEMRGPLVESEFWDMDALFMPQFHPAREIHDVYFVKDAPVDPTIPKDLIDQVAQVHETGGKTGSRGWRYPFDAKRTRRLVLRSQGTAVSARTLGEGPKVPGKYFSIARCFRYDQVDATHAPDFFQVEGIVLGPEIHFRTLLGLLTLFAKELARAESVKFLPAYFPFTEPSVEMHVRHPRLGWMELGGAGLFRPEVTGPLGVEVPVIAWGLGLDRMAMMALGLSDIRDLFSADLGLIREKQQILKLSDAKT